MWSCYLQDNYSDEETWQGYSDIYGLAERLGFKSAHDAWVANPFIQGGTDPKDFKVVKKPKKIVRR